MKLYLELNFLINNNKNALIKLKINILFVGDLLQLPTVNGRPVFNKTSNKLVLKHLKQINN